MAGIASSDTLSIYMLMLQELNCKLRSKSADSALFALAVE
jgi:hypothetical protein